MRLTVRGKCTGNLFILFKWASAVMAEIKGVVHKSEAASCASFA